jgi:hypothetical protein
MFERLCSDYAEMIQALRDRADELQISRLDLDEIAGFHSGYSSKLLASRPAKIVGPISFGPLIQTLGLRLFFIEDEASTARTVARRTPVDRSNQRFGNKNNSRPSLKIAAPQSEPAPVSHLVLVKRARPGCRKYG